MAWLVGEPSLRPSAEASIRIGMRLARVASALALTTRRMAAFRRQGGMAIHDATGNICSAAAKLGASLPLASPEFTGFVHGSGAFEHRTHLAENSEPPYDLSRG